MGRRRTRRSNEASTSAAGPGDSSEAATSAAGPGLQHLADDDLLALAEDAMMRGDRRDLDNVVEQLCMDDDDDGGKAEDVAGDDDDDQGSEQEEGDDEEGDDEDLEEELEGEVRGGETRRATWQVVRKSPLHWSDSPAAIIQLCNEVVTRCPAVLIDKTKNKKQMWEGISKMFAEHCVCKPHFDKKKIAPRSLQNFWSGFVKIYKHNRSIAGKSGRPGVKEYYDGLYGEESHVSEALETWLEAVHQCKEAETLKKKEPKKGPTEEEKEEGRTVLEIAKGNVGMKRPRARASDICEALRETSRQKTEVHQLREDREHARHMDIMQAQRDTNDLKHARHLEMLKVQRETNAAIIDAVKDATQEGGIVDRVMLTIERMFDRYQRTLERIATPRQRHDAGTGSDEEESD